MFKALVATTAVLVCLTGYQTPAKAWCSNMNGETIQECKTRSRIQRLEREQERIRLERTPCINGWQGSRITGC